ncbi:MAG: glycosyltransferase [Actinomycetota bacterium]|nr:glycosyltransferase [Actinomycetota bacterium]
MNSKTAVAVVSSYREEGTISATVSGLKKMEILDEVVVVDDASGDDSAREASKGGARVVVNGKNLGKGASLSRVLENLDYDYFLLVDGDVGETASETHLLLEALFEGKADLAIAAFPPPTTKGGFGIAKGIARLGIWAFTGMKMTSPLSGQRAVTKELLKRVLPLEKGFGVEVGMTIDAARSGFRVVEVATNMSHCETGRNLAGFAHRGRQLIDILRVLLKRARGMLAL